MRIIQLQIIIFYFSLFTIPFAGTHVFLNKQARLRNKYKLNI